jgi:sugar lactone lactonase YvrE
MGESPLWVPGGRTDGRSAGGSPGGESSAGGTLNWVDAEGVSIYRWDPASASWGYRSVDVPVKAIVRKSHGGLVAVAEKALFARDLEELRLLPGTGIPNLFSCYNGAVVDHRGRLLVSAYHEAKFAGEDTVPPVAAPPAGGSIFRFERGSGPVEIDRNLALPKGMCMSPDGKRLYLAEMLENRILVYDYDPETGGLSNRRTFAETEGGEGTPGGLAVDEQGFLWCAHWGGWRVTRYAPGGERDRTYALPVSIATALCFGGDGLGDLFVTTAWFGLRDDERESEPMAGDLFRIQPGVKGIPEREFAE